MASVADFGGKCIGLLASYCRDTLSWRTSQRCLDGEWEMYLETWPRSGMTRNGIAFELPTSVPRTDEIESGLLPTPEASNTKAVALRSNGRRPKSYLPTPRAIYGEHPGMKDPKHLTGAIHHWATPQSRDFRTGQQSRWENPERTRNLNDQIGGQLNPTWVEWLMGYPLGWTALEDSVTPSSRKSQSGSEGE